MYLENFLIAQLPRRGQSRLLALSDAVQLPPGNVLCEPGARTRHVYFPRDAVVALVDTVTGARALGVGMVGCESMLRAHLTLGVAGAPVQALVQGAGCRCRVVHCELQQCLLIRYRRGEISVLDRPGLQGAACGRHAADRLAYDALLGARRCGQETLVLTLLKAEAAP